MGCSSLHYAPSLSTLSSQSKPGWEISPRHLILVRKLLGRGESFWARDILALIARHQGYFMVTCAVACALETCFVSRKWCHCLSASFSGNEKRFRKWYFSLCCHCVSEELDTALEVRYVGDQGADTDWRKSLLLWFGSLFPRLKHPLCLRQFRQFSENAPIQTSADHLDGHIAAWPYWWWNRSASPPL